MKEAIGKFRFDSATKFLVLFTAISLLLAGLFTVGRNINNPFLWFDEAVQFWISKGMSPYGEATKASFGVLEVIENNYTYDLDPGGFSILLHFWTNVSNSSIWLRLLPFLFFLGLVVAFVYLSYIWTKNLGIAFLLGLLPIVFTSIVSMGFEIRPYSMEYLGVLLGIIAIESLKSKISLIRVVIWGLILSIFMTSRYSLIVIVMCVSLVAIYLIVKSTNPPKQKYFLLLGYSAPLFTSLVLIIFVTLRNQNPQLSQVYYLSYLIEDWKLLVKPSINFFYLAFLIFQMILLTLSWAKHDASFQKYIPLFFVSISSNFLFILLSFLGRYPWEPFSNRGGAYFLTSLLCLSVVIGEILVALYERPGRLMYLGAIFLYLSSIFVHFHWDNPIFQQTLRPMWYCLAGIDYSNYSKIYTDRWGTPIIRYLFEYGSLHQIQASIYPERFEFAPFNGPVFADDAQAYAEYYQNQPRMDDLSSYDLLIIPELSFYDSSKSELWKLVDGCNANVFVRNQ